MGNFKTAMIIGANGLVGNELLQLLLKSDYYTTVVSVTRRALNLSHKKLLQLVIDYNRLYELKEIIGADDVYCCLGTTIKKAGSQEKFRTVDYEYPIKMAKLSLSNGSRQFLLVSSLGASVKSSVFYSRTKGEVEEEIKKMDYEGIHIFQPSLLLGDRSEKRTGEDLAKRIFNIIPFIFKGALKKYKPIEASKVAEVMYKVAQENNNGTHTYVSDEMLEM